MNEEGRSGQGHTRLERGPLGGESPAWGGGSLGETAGEEALERGQSLSLKAERKRDRERDRDTQREREREREREKQRETERQTDRHRRRASSHLGRQAEPPPPQGEASFAVFHLPPSSWRLSL